MGNSRTTSRSTNTDSPPAPTAAMEKFTKSPNTPEIASSTTLSRLLPTPSTNSIGNSSSPYRLIAPKLHPSPPTPSPTTTSSTHICTRCNPPSRCFSTAASLKRHVEIIHLGLRFKCPVCKQQSTSQKAVDGHMKRRHREEWDAGQALLAMGGGVYIAAGEDVKVTIDVAAGTQVEYEFEGEMDVDVEVGVKVKTEARDDRDTESDPDIDDA
ncbi:hypothetical protein F5882DRAFT_489568 [Hyaloscypha sp. PMI_1271]|nr:hypothetical protein F5882DRAFT_489568 [Hyaloscypha sp. PMI_1271]